MLKVVELITLSISYKNILLILFFSTLIDGHDLLKNTSWTENSSLLEKLSQVSRQKRQGKNFENHINFS